MASESTITFIGVQFLRENSIINDNVDAQVLGPVIRMAQSKYIQSVIGSSLYNKLISDVQANTVTGNYQILLEDYIIPTLTQYSVYESIPYMTFKFRNKGIQKQNSDNSQPADLTELSYMRDNVKNTAEFYAERMATYLCENSGLFTEYRSGNEDVNANTERYFNGVFIPRRRGWNHNNQFINNRFDDMNGNIIL